VKTNELDGVHVILKSLPILVQLNRIVELSQITAGIDSVCSLFDQLCYPTPSFVDQ